MKKILLATLSTISVTFAFGQNGLGIKVYQNTDIFTIDYYESTSNPSTIVDQVNFHRFSLAVNIQTQRGLIHEIELFVPEISRSLDDIQYPMNYELRKGDSFDSEVSSYSLRYELSKTLTDDTKRFAFNFGAGINPYYVNIEYFPNVETTYFMATELYGFAVNITPRLKYKITNRFHIDLNVPLKVYDLRAEKKRIHNPAIPIRQQTTNDVDNIFFESAYTIRLGLMYRLTK